MFNVMMKGWGSQSDNLSVAGEILRILQPICSSRRNHANIIHLTDLRWETKQSTYQNEWLKHRFYWLFKKIKWICIKYLGVVSW